jgi:hypothetical protein
MVDAVASEPRATMGCWAWQAYDNWALKYPGITSMVMGNRRMNGWVRVAPEAFGDDELRIRLLDSSLAFVRSLPSK